MTRVNIKRVKPKKKPKRSTLKNKCDKKWRVIIHKRIYCEICNEFGQNAHHIIGRNNYHLRWNIRNGCYLCVGCHYQVHENPLWFADWLRGHRTDDYEYLLTQKNIKWDKQYDKVLEYLNIMEVESG